MYFKGIVPFGNKNTSDPCYSSIPILSVRLCLSCGLLYVTDGDGGGALLRFVYFQFCVIHFSFKNISLSVYLLLIGRGKL